MNLLLNTVEENFQDTNAYVFTRARVLGSAFCLAEIAIFVGQGITALNGIISIFNKALFLLFRISVQLSR